MEAVFSRERGWHVQENGNVHVTVSTVNPYVQPDRNGGERIIWFSRMQF